MVDLSYLQPIQVLLGEVVVAPKAQHRTVWVQSANPMLCINYCCFNDGKNGCENQNYDKNNGTFVCEKLSYTYKYKYFPKT